MMSHPQVPDSRDAILVAAQRLFVDRGYRGISMREIADAVGMTKAALYYYFRDKEELFVAILDSVLHELSALVDAQRATSASSRAQIEAIVRQIMVLPVERRAGLRLASQELSNLDAATRQQFVERYHTQFIGRITLILAGGIQRGEFKPVDAGVATWALLGMMYPYLHTAPVPGALPAEALIQQILLIFFDGLQANL
jgi:AcrR family transcriptional regulator